MNRFILFLIAFLLSPCMLLAQGETKQGFADSAFTKADKNGDGRLGSDEVKNDVLEQKFLKGAECNVIRKELQAALDRMPAEGQSLFKFD